MLYQVIHSAAIHSTSSRVFSGPVRNGEPSRIASFLNSPIVDSANALSYADGADRCGDALQGDSTRGLEPARASTDDIFSKKQLIESSRSRDLEL